MDAKNIVSTARKRMDEGIKRANGLIKKGYQHFTQLPGHQRYYISAGTIMLVAIMVVLAVPKQRKAIATAPYMSNQGAFTVEAPNGEMQLTTDQFPFLDQQVNRFTHQNVSVEGVFRVVHFDLPPGLISTPDYVNTLNMLAAIFAIPFNGIITASRETKLQDYQGITITAEGQMDDRVIRGEALIIIVSNRIYMVGVHGPKRGFAHKVAHRFIHSFKLNF
jgi:hypothetical protein